MSEKAIRELKKKIIRVATFSFVIVMVFMGGLMYLSNLLVIRHEVRQVLTSIVENDGILEADELREKEEGGQSADSSSSSRAASAPTDGDGGETEKDQSADSKASEGKNDTGKTSTGGKETEEPAESEDKRSFQDVLREFFGTYLIYESPEFSYTARYFSVNFNADGSVEAVRVGHIAAVDETRAVEYAKSVRKRYFDFGSFGDYYYRTLEKPDGSAVVAIMDCTNQITMMKRILLSALILIGFGMLLSYFVMRVMAERIAQPEIKSASLQKQFITNASHELKTPLAVIRANTELTEAMSGKTEWTESTMRQVDRLQALIQNLVLVTRAQEKDSKADRTDIDVSKVVRETVDTFAPVAEQDEKKLAENIPDGIHMTAEEGQIRQLVSVLVDNALKYCDEKGEIRVDLEKKNRQVRLAVSNDYKDGKDVDYDRFFERFYREDQSHSQDRGGFGIGLSIAENLVEKYNGKISVTWKDGVITFLCQLAG